MFRFETLDIWKLGVDYCNVLFKCVETFPKEVKYNLGSQLREAALSVSNNIAEGSGSCSTQEFKNFLNYSIRSLYETVSMLFIMRDNNLIASDQFQEFYQRAEVLVKKIRSFRNTL